MRQSEGNRTVKRLSATRLAQELLSEETFCGTIECLATAMVAWPARIRSPVLLKTASLIPRTRLHPRPISLNALPCYFCSIATNNAARQRCGSMEPAALPETCPAPSSADRISGLARR